MATASRIVDIIVPNRSTKKVRATLTIAPTDPARLDGLAFEGAPLETENYGLTTEMCGDPNSRKLQKKLTVTLEPFQDVTVRAVIMTNDPAKGKAIAAFAVSETRGRKLTGGVTIVCTSPQYPSDLPAAPDPAKPCPIMLAASLAVVDPGSDPSSASSPGVIDTKHPQDLVAVIENPKRKTLTNAVMWLEHLDQSGVTAEPKVWNIGTIEPKGRFWATWEVDGRGASPGRWEATFVVGSDNYDPVRIRAAFTVLPRDQQR